MAFGHGGELVARTLAAQGVQTIYTLCGGHIAPVYDGCLNHEIAILDFRHEQAAAHAADAHARLTRNIGVAVVTAGPGVTDAVTAVANAYQARSPLLLRGGAAPLQRKGMGALQELPQTGLFGDIAKASFTVETTAAIPEQLGRAVRTALSGRPGPVFVELPFDVLFNFVDQVTIPDRFSPRPLVPETAALRQAFELLRAADRPLLVAGTQVYWDEAHRVLAELTEQTGIPIFTNGAGRGTLPMTHPHCFKAARSAALREADVVVVVGTPLDFRLKYGRKGWNEDARLIQVENDPAEINRNRPADVALVANARLVLEALVEGLHGVRYDDWLARVGELEAEKQVALDDWQALDDAPVNHFRLGAELNRLLDQRTVLIGDGGDIVGACAKVVDVLGPGLWLDPGPLGCLGVGPPFAIAAQHLYPERRVLIISGDGSFGLNGFEFDTAVRFGLPIVSVVGNDAGWGQIRGAQIQMVGSQRAVATDLAPTRYDQVVIALGGYGEHVDNPAAIVPAVERAFASGQPACIDVALDPEGMVKTGASTPYVV
ncbi:MAG: thiamine pyrophosphate-binding protein [Candidatus Promineifilaceae bacterium]|nr:thiamine pyrophosphate-binding protein [Candidatus Promineifilaceae bacterium]